MSEHQAKASRAHVKMVEQIRKREEEIEQNRKKMTIAQNDAKFEI